MRFSALGDSAIVAGCGEGISRQTLQRVRQFASAVESAEIAGVVDVVPAFASVTVFYVPGEVERGEEGAYAKVLARLEEIAAALPPAPPSTEGSTVEIPVCYGGEYGPDLEAVARIAKLSPDEVVRLHREGEYLVHAIGFAPGFPYLGGLPETLHAPRLATPRVRVEPGSVGIGGAQTGIYPLATPGGWQLIGRTPLELFDAARAKPSLLSVGDTVKFREIAAAEFRAAGAKEKAVAPRGAPDVARGLRVRRAGGLTTVQDRGRVGHRKEGVAQGGAADPVALRVANWLVGNDANAPALEFTLVGPELEFLTDAVVALAGATFGDFPLWQPVTVRAGTRINFGAAGAGCRGYLAVAGGFEVPKVLGSASTALRAGFGGFHGRALREGDELDWRPKSLRIPGGWRIDERALPTYDSAPTVRVIRGAQAEDFFEQLLAAEFTVSPRADRMGLRLSGPEIRSREAKELISTAVAPGTIQIPADGQPIVLLCDAQTIGGYPQAAHVITVDLPIVAQLRPGDRLRFREVSLEDAQKFLFTREHVLAMLHEGIFQKLG